MVDETDGREIRRVGERRAQLRGFRLEGELLLLALRWSLRCRVARLKVEW